MKSQRLYHFKKKFFSPLEKVIILVMIISFLASGYYIYRLLYEQNIGSRVEGSLPISLSNNNPVRNYYNSSDIKILNASKNTMQDLLNSPGSNIESCSQIAKMNIPILNRAYKLLYADDNDWEYKCMDKGSVLSNRGGVTGFPGQEGFIHITGHRDTSLTNLKELKDKIDKDRMDGNKNKCYTVSIRYQGNIYHYCITGYKTEPKVKYGKPNIVIPDSVMSNRSFIFLTTCFPFGYFGDAPNVIIFTGPLFDPNSSF